MSTTTPKPRRSTAPFLIRRVDAITRMEKNKALIDKYRALGSQVERFDYDRWALDNKEYLLSLIGKVPVSIDTNTNRSYYSGETGMSHGEVTITIRSQDIPEWPLKPKNSPLPKEALAIVNEWVKSENAGQYGRGKSIGSRYDRMAAMIELLKISDEQYIDAKFYDEIQLFVTDIENKLVVATNIEADAN